MTGGNAAGAATTEGTAVDLAELDLAEVGPAEVDLAEAAPAAGTPEVDVMTGAVAVQIVAMAGAGIPDAMAVVVAAVRVVPDHVEDSANPWH